MSAFVPLQHFPQELAEWMQAQGQPAFRGKQLFAWLHKGTPFEHMSNMPKALRDTLQQQAVEQPAAILERHVSQLDGTVKYLFELRDGHCVEGVLMRYHHGNTLCLSTQVGCRMGCAFCASTLGGLLRQLTAAEMLHMVVLANGELVDGRVNNIVLMGSGEPLDNYDEVVRFLRLVSHPEGLHIGLRHISLSTCGLVEQLERFASEGLPVTLSVSLHAPNDVIRKQLMPIANAWPIARLMQACRLYLEKTGRRVVFEYALVDGVNNLPAHAEELSRLLWGMQCHVNLIPLNHVPERDLRGVSRRQAEDFLKLLVDKGLSATLRREMGDDISGACGQLRSQYLKAGAAVAAAQDMGEEGRT